MAGSPGASQGGPPRTAQLHGRWDHRLRPSLQGSGDSSALMTQRVTRVLHPFTVNQKVGNRRDLSEMGVSQRVCETHG